MSYRIRFTLPDGRSWVFDYEYATREEAQRALDKSGPDVMGATYTIFKLPNATPDATSSQQGPTQPVPPIGVMPRCKWEQQRIHTLASAIARATVPGEACATAHVHDLASEIVDLCKPMEGKL